MAFSEDTIDIAWARSGGRCECKRILHNHPYNRCPKNLVFKNRGRTGRGCWEAHHKVSTGGDGLANCQIFAGNVTPEPGHLGGDIGHYRAVLGNF